MDEVNDPARVDFVDVQRTLTLFAQGLAGRPLHLQPIEERSAAERPGRIAIDGVTLHLPAAVADFADRRHNLGSYRVAVLHQLGFLHEGTAEFDLATLAARVDLPPPRLGWTPRPPSALERFFATARRPALLRRVFSTLEDLRIDSALHRRWPGAGPDLARVLAHALDRRPALADLRPLAAALEVLVQHSLGAARADLITGDATGLHDRIIALATCVESAEADVHDSAEAALAITALLEPLIHRPLRRSAGTLAVKAPEGDATSDAEPPGSGDADEVPDQVTPEDFDGPGVAFRGEMLPELAHRRQPGGIAGTLPGSAKAPQVEAPRPRDRARRDTPAETRPTRLRAYAERAAIAGPRSFYYDEWDCHRQRWLKGWCRLIEQRLAGEHAGFIDEVRRRHAALAGQVRRSFGFIRPDAWHRVHRTPDGDELEIDAVIDAVIDRRIGRAGDAQEGDLYVRRDRALREVATAFLVDMSASTDFAVPDPLAPPPPPAEPLAPSHDDDMPYLYGGYADRAATNAPVVATPKRRVIDIAKESIALMCDALHAFGDSHAVYGFSGDGRQQVEFFVAKHFNEPWAARAWAALAAMQPRRSTRTGPAIRHAVAKLARQPARTRLLIVISDGYPQDSDYGPDPNDADYGIADTARALQEAERAGITAFCITIDPAGHDYLRRMCAESRYLVIADVNRLPGELGKVYRQLAATASGPKRRP